MIDRIIQQAITQRLIPNDEPLFADGSYGYQPNRSAKDAILKIKEYAEQGYTFAVVLDLSKYSKFRIPWLCIGKERKWHPCPSSSKVMEEVQV